MSVSFTPAEIVDEMSPVPEVNAPSPTPYRFYVLSVLGVISFFNLMDRAVLSVMVEPIKAELNITDTQVGLLAGFTFAVFYAALGVPLARLIDRRSRVVILSVAVALWSGVTAISGLAQNFAQLLLARVGVAVGEASCIPCTHSLVSDYFPPPERAFALSAFQAAGVAGSTLGLAAAGFAADTLGWRWAFIIIGLPGLLVSLLVWFTLREPTRGVYAARTARIPGSGRFIDEVRLLLGQRTYRSILGGLAILAFSLQGLTVWTPTFYVRVHHLSLTEAGVAVGVPSGICGVSGLVLGGITAIHIVRLDRRWECWLPMASLLIALPFQLGAFLTPSTPLSIGLLAVAAFAASFGTGTSLASFHAVTPPHVRALAASLVMFSTAMIGLGAGPFIVGLLSDAFQPRLGAEAIRYALACSLAVKLLAAFFFYRASRTFREDLLS